MKDDKKSIPSHFGFSFRNIDPIGMLHIKLNLWIWVLVLQSTFVRNIFFLYRGAQRTTAISVFTFTGDMTITFHSNVGTSAGWVTTPTDLV